MIFLPLASQKLAVNADEYRPYPKDEKNINKILLVIWVFVYDCHGNCEKKANEHRSPKVPFL
jgi:hypothetical protein